MCSTTDHSGPPSLNPNSFYLSVLEQELAGGGLRPEDRLLVCCGGNQDRVTLLAAGFRDVVISNLAHHRGHAEYEPYTWERQDIEDLSYADESFDVVIVHSGLHHCYNPYRALGEMCRVARRLVIAFEPYETWLTRLGAGLGFGQRYEDSAVFLCGGGNGGVANTEIPNFVFRFCERDVRKFARVRFPHGEAPLRFYRALRFNFGRFETHRSRMIRWSFQLARPWLRLLARWLPAFNNNLAFAIERPGPLQFHPWIRLVDGLPRVDFEYLERKYARKGTAATGR